MEKWQGQVSYNLHSIKAEQAWSLLGDFFNLHKFLPSLATCRKADGSDGCVRYCAAAPDPTGQVFWVKEKLVASDVSKRSYSYEIVESNMGFGEYFAILRVVEGGNGNEGCKIEWEFECEPIVGWGKDEFVGYMENGVKEMAKRVGEGLLGVISVCNGDGK